MGIYGKLAFRNIFRNARRTAITLAAMAFGSAAIILFGGFVHFTYWGVRESTIHSQLGHIQIYKRGYSERGHIAPFDYLIPDVPTITALVAAVEHVAIVTPRLGFSGLISTGDTTTSFIGLGVDPEKEADLSSFVSIIDGKDLSKQQSTGAILGKGLAAGLEAKPGDALTILSTTRHGSINAAEILVRGIFESSTKEFDDRAIKVPFSAVESLLDTEGAVQSLGIVLAKVISIHGIPMAPPPGSTRGYIAQIWVIPEIVRLACTLSLLTAVLSSFYPAFRASRLNVVEALRHV